MKPICLRACAAIALSFSIAACVPRTAPPPPAPPAPPPPVAAPAPPQAPPPATNWIDNPATAGDWTYSARPVPTAVFADSSGAALFTMRCDPASRQMALERAATPAGAGPLVIRTGTQDRTLATQDVAAARSTLAAQVSARDPLLDAMAFSRGRFAVEARGAAPLYLPSWPEITRVIEACRG
ncbi:hypothetical protein EYB45_07070 [Erythrobacteraceae bacterium CFH 75059]|uniref:hypothetical protein n=1 Tax=Qipengyuania thermophila TaxID=2509361 RepID=UPI00101F3307|nr:hypothetical protein [Qipengyuania thermophila]TCD05242.1 hypothetical protein EYB45_07070 [Erythrobacteraceae bacterium CFH 75059]